MKDKIILSQDGSHTVVSSKFNVSYHSKYGAIQETETVFLEAGLHNVQKEKVSIFEMGFGTGLNAIMTLLNSSDKKITYHTIEAYPLPPESYSELNYPQVLDLDENLTDAFYKMHQSSHGEAIDINQNFSFCKFLEKIEDHQFESQYDIIYYDAFAPSSQEELWTEELMKKLFKCTAQGGILVTYCAKGSFKRALKSAGYIIEALPGPTGKREMTRARKPS